MIARTRTTAALVAALALGCGDDGQAPTKPDETTAGEPETAGEAPAEAPPETVVLDLDPILPATMKAPAGARVVEGVDADAEVMTPDQSFSLSIDGEAADIAARKEEIAEDEVTELEEILVDEPDALVYVSASMGKAEHHFVANVEVGDATYSCEDQKGTFWSRAQIESMLEACRSLAPRE